MLLCYMKWAVVFNFLDQLYIIVVVCFLKGNVRDPILLQSRMLMIPMGNIYDLLFCFYLKFASLENG